MVLVTEEGECWFDLPIIAEYIELMNVVGYVAAIRWKVCRGVQKSRHWRMAFMECRWQSCVNRRVQRRAV